MARDHTAILLALFLQMFVLLRVAWTYNADFSTPILAGIAACMLAVSSIRARPFLSRTFLRASVFLLVGFLVILVDFLARDNEFVSLRAYEFLIYAGVPLLLLSRVRDVRDFLVAYAVLSVLIFAVYVSDPFNGYLFSGGYMVYGFQAMVPACFGLHLGRKVFGFRLLVVLEVVGIGMMVVFGNRMAAFAVFAFMVMMDIARQHSTRVRLVRLAGLLLLLGTVIGNVREIIDLASDALTRSGYSSYALNSLRLYFDRSVASLSDTRSLLWADGMDMFLKKPVVGHGIGYFESVYGIYVHNVFLDMMVSYGVVGLSALVVLIGNSLREIVRSQGDLRVFGVVLLCTSFPKLLTSVYAFVEPTFWMLAFFGFYAPLYRRRHARVPVKCVVLDG